MPDDLNPGKEDSLLEAVFTALEKFALANITRQEKPIDAEAHCTRMLETALQHIPRQGVQVEHFLFFARFAVEVKGTDVTKLALVKNDGNNTPPDVN